jgi:hypothetical protein
MSEAMRLAEQALDAALDELECAMVKVRGARQRLQMLQDHEQWKLLKELSLPPSSSAADGASQP